MQWIAGVLGSIVIWMPWLIRADSFGGGGGSSNRFSLPASAPMFGGGADGVGGGGPFSGASPNAFMPDAPDAMGSSSSLNNRFGASSGSSPLSSNFGADRSEVPEAHRPAPFDAPAAGAGSLGGGGSMQPTPFGSVGGGADASTAAGDSRNFNRTPFGTPNGANDASPNSRTPVAAAASNRSHRASNAPVARPKDAAADRSVAADALLQHLAQLISATPSGGVGISENEKFIIISLLNDVSRKVDAMQSLLTAFVNNFKNQNQNRP